MVIEKNLSNYYEGDFHVVINVTHGKVPISRDIINLVKDIKNICPYLKEISISYCARECNREVNSKGKSAHRQLV